MTLTELRYLVAVAELGHFGKAAEACHVSQPSLSVAIRKLEDELQVALFTRARKNVQLTEAGEIILVQAKRVLSEADTLLRTARDLQNPFALPFRVGAIHTIGPYFFPRWIAEVTAIEPRCHLYVQEDLTATLEAALASDALDAIVIATPFDEPGYEQIELYSEPFYLLARSDHPLAQRKQVQVRELDDVPLLMLGEGHCLRAQILDACPVVRVQDRLQDIADTGSRLVGGSLEAIRHMVRSGLGVSVFPRSALQMGDAQLVAVPIINPKPVRHVRLVWPKRLAQHPALEVIRRAALQCVADD